MTPLHRNARRAVLAVTSTIAAAALVTSCASFSDQDAAQQQGDFSPLPSVVEQPKAPPPPTTDEVDPPEGPCVDPNPAVIATCLETTSGVRPADPTGKTTYVAERTTGKIFISKRYGPQREIASARVDGSGDGGLVDFVLSPAYQSDQMIYALITTGSDNRVVRIAPTGSAQPVLTGIPKGPRGNMGSISLASPTELIVATGDAGDRAAAKDPSSLAGKILSIDLNRPNAKPDVRASGLGSNVALCPSGGADGQLFVADSGADGDRLSVVGSHGLRKLWSWADRPGIGGCAASDSTIAVSIPRAQRLDVFSTPKSGSPSIGEPSESDLSKTFGAVGRMVTYGGGPLQLATINTSTPGAKPQSFDDRVAMYLPESATEDRM
ncbi:PQQ-dependent sugar dehydrogenase [Gordonia shandongensis]|uniref:PQQ-dependent sugar dehydrogenase n=1 Tax=Gordonia shandongensis TaxID=376351 RepID=UPI0006853BB6|nr:PQQ-dependent sugar dehydrogenase [Gordonia shandongensis]